MARKKSYLKKSDPEKMTLQELKFFSIYLSKIDAGDPSTRIVRFYFEELGNIMDLEKIDMQNIDTITHGLLSKIINIPLRNNGFIAFQLFQSCTVAYDENKKWYMEIDAHDDALPLMFEFKEKYFDYQSCDVLHLLATL